MEIPNQFSYVSAPTSPSRFNIENMNFYSVPTRTSPTRGLSSAQLGFAIEPTTPTYEDAKSSFDDFEFDTSWRFSLTSNSTETYQNFENPLEHQLQQQKQERQSEDSLSLPTMAFADDLFSDGKVLPQSPLKLPPRLQYVNNKSGNQSLAGSPPWSPGSVFKLSFSRWSMWNDDFDPFMVALENVREKKRGKIQGHNHRRARSLSPLRAARPQESNYLTGSIHHQDKKLGPQIPMEHESNAFATLNNPHEPIEQVGQSPKKLAEPKGLSFARQVRLVKMDHEMHTKPNMTTPSGPTVKAEESGKEIVGSFTRENKRLNIRKFLFRSAIEREQNVAQCKGDKKVAKVAKMTVIQYRPRLLLCMGFGAKYVE